MGGANILGLALSYAGIFALIALAGGLLRAGAVRPAASRKIVHIGVSHWWLLMMATMDRLWVAALGPVTFIIINWLSLKLRLFKAMEDPEPGKNYGTIYFPISLLVLVSASYAGLMPLWVGGVGILIMGWGDGLAALVGERFGSVNARIFGSMKSVVGAAAMFAASFIVTLAMGLWFDPAAGFLTLALRAAATAALRVSIETGTSTRPHNARTTGTTRSNSSASGTGSDPGRVDSPPTSIMSAPAAAMATPCATAVSN